MMDVHWLTERLPSVEIVPRRSEADYYGASDLISSALGLPSPPRSCASWKHGVTYTKHWKHPELMLTESCRLTRHLVTVDFQIPQLRSRGFIRVHAVGAPFLYVEPWQISRVQKSLLIMPAHSLGSTDLTFDEQGYVEAISTIRDRFEIVVACIGAHSVRNGEWTQAFERIGIPWITGADSSDRNALRRMARLFDSFEYVTSNTLGSHIAYAAYRGCKVSLWGSLTQYKLEHFKRVPWYQKHWSIAAEIIESISEQNIRRRYPFLFKNPWEAVPLEQWAAEYLGVECKREPAELARLLGWTAIGQAEAFILHAARRGARLSRAASLRIRRSLSI